MARHSPHWFIITPEYPPSPGGVSDYTFLVARELAARGHVVETWAPSARQGPPPLTPGVSCHELPDHFGRASMRLLDAALTRAPRHAIVLVQYVPSGFGARSMNLPFALWLGLRKERRWLMVHEAAFPFVRGGPLRHDLLAIVTRAMLAAALAGSERVFMSTPAWAPILRRYGFGRHPVEWLPVPASVPTTASAVRVREIRRELSVAPDGIVVGHFGSYGSLVAEPLTPIINLLAARHADWKWLMLGRGADRFVESMGARFPGLNAVFPRPNLSADEVANHLGVLDAVVLPFPDGISTRRTSAMAALAVGAPIVTTSGASTEDIWRLTDAVVLADARPENVAKATTALLRDPDRRARLSAQGRALYQERFAVGRLADTLARLV